MGTNGFQRLLFLAAAGIVLLGGLTAPALARGRASTPNPVPDRIRIVSTVELHKADGSIVLAEALSEIYLNADGTANGALGLRELGSGNSLKAYRVFAGQASDDNVYLFNAQRLSLPEGPVTITFRRLNPRSRAQSVTVTFQVVVDDPTGVGAFNFVTQGEVLPHPTDLIIDRFGYIDAQSQSVIVQTSRGSYTASFTNVALVFPSVGAIGWLELAAPEGSTPESDQTFGIWQITDGRVLNILQGKFIVMRPRPNDTSVSTIPQGWFSVGPAPGASEQTYDIYASRPSGVLKFEAQANITLF